VFATEKTIDKPQLAAIQ